MPKAESSIHERLVGGFGVLVCGAMLMLAVPRFIASLYALYPEAAVKQTSESSEKLSEQVYQKCIADLTQALAWHQDSEYWQTQAFFYLALFNATASQPSSTRQEWLKQARTSIVQGLKLSPVDPYGWFRLATVDNMLEASTTQIVEALRLSFYAGRVEPDLSMARLRFAYDYYPDFDVEMRQIWLKQIPIAWAFQAEPLIDFVVSRPTLKPLVEAAFINSPDEWLKFSQALEKHTQKKP